MRLLVATAGDGPASVGLRQVFLDLAQADVVGEHRLESDPERADAVLFVDLQQYLGDPFPRALRRHELVRRHAGKVFVYDERDVTSFTFPGVYVGGSRRLARRRPVVGGPYPWLPRAPAVPAAEPELLFCFRGTRTHPVRDAVLGLRHERGRVAEAEPLEYLSRHDAARDSPLERARAAHAELIARSKFVLCPRGHGPSSFRLYEALAAGRVPVVVSDDWLPPPRVDWEACAVRVPERDVAAIPRRLEEREHEWPEMAAAGRAAMDTELGPARLWHHFASSIADLRGARRPRTALWWAQPQALRLNAHRVKRAVVRREAT